MKCIRCNRPLSPGNTTGIGPICAALGFRGEREASGTKARVHFLSRRPDGSRRYVVFEDGEEYRVMLGEKRISGRTFGVCDCSRRGCEHVAAAIKYEERKTQ